ncbi:PAS domain S-box protein [Rhodoferax saidenbachensis]|uniref:histidine kinase n=1 Tax=Rhodoferax saidenbachensis TaxID=1484693 RepID=A0A1P8KE08_9BURK|nr:PAS domain S-box protein [Rhodoferax saidenbachensis]APW44239.1 hypothetical protein RS694_18030 [Rhodoferax saidenbachensis]
MNKSKIAKTDEGGAAEVPGSSIQFADYMQNIVAQFDAQFRHLYVNKAVETATGLPSEWFLGKTNRELGMPRVLCDLWDRELRTVFESGRTSEISFSFDGPSQKHQIYSRLIPLQGEDGIVTSVVSDGKDITDLAQAQAQLQTLIRERKAFELDAERFRAIVQHSDDAIISKSLDGRITSWNRGAAAIFGYTEEEMMGKPMVLLFPPDRLQEEGFILEKLLAGEKVDHFETVRMRKDQSLVNVSVTISPIRDATGRIVGASKIARDITQRLRMEVMAEHFAAIVASTDDAIISKSLDGTVTSWNPAAQAMFGYASQEILGKSIRRIIPDDLWNDEDLILERLRQGEKIDHFETVRRHKNGSLLDVSVTISPIRDADGWITGASKIVRDNSARKRYLAAQKEHINRSQMLTRQVIEAQEDERRRVALELHDELGQTLTALKINLQLAQQAPSTTPGHLSESLTLIDHAMREVRRLAHTLRPPMLDDLGLIPALRWLVDQHTSRSKAEILFDHDLGGTRLPPEMETVCFRVAQEALTNIARHAHASRVVIDLRKRAGWLDMTLTDNGRGFDIRAKRALAEAGASLGILGMQQRADAVGAQFSMDAQLGQGCTVTLRKQIEASE